MVDGSDDAADDAEDGRHEGDAPEAGGPPAPEGSPGQDRGASRGLPPSPDVVVEAAGACVRFVERALGVRLDFEAETLPVLDHWLRGARADERPEAAALVARAAGAYIGEVVRRRHASWWRVEGGDPSSWRIELRDVFLSFAPVDVARDAMGLDRGPDGELLDVASLDLDDDDREAVSARLAELPRVSDEELRSPSTRVEVVDIAVEAIRQRQAADGAPPLALEPADYGPTVH
jgi:hypothetical protein